MEYFYSKTTGGFYIDIIHGDNMPADAVQISLATYESLMAAQSAGQRIQPDTNGNPIAVAQTPTAAQIACNAAFIAINGGLKITSTSACALNGIYSVTPQAQANINSVMTYAIINEAFPGRFATLIWYDIDGGSHTFETTDQFKAFANAIADYVAVISIYANSGGQVGAIPSNSVTIP